VKQPDERAAFRIESTQVRSLARIAVVAGESDVFVVASSDMLGFARFLRFGNMEGLFDDVGGSIPVGFNPIPCYPSRKESAYENHTAVQHYSAS
jgi:hypothetical protein